MKVILNQTIAKVGKQGQVANVSDGFARNFLFPQRLAIPADKASLARLDADKDARAADIEKTRDAASKLGEKLDGVTIRVTGQTAPGHTKLFGAVTTANIAEAIKENQGIEIEKKQVALLHPIKRLGVYEVLIDFHTDVDATIRLEVADEQGNLGIEEEAETTEEYDAALAEAEAEKEAARELGAKGIEDADAAAASTDAEPTETASESADSAGSKDEDSE